MRNTEILKRFKLTTAVTNLGLTEDAASNVLAAAYEAITSTLVDYGYVEMLDELRLDITPTKPRIHVLRGNTYTSKRNFKIKATVNGVLYDKIADSFSDLLGGLYSDS